MTPSSQQPRLQQLLSEVADGQIGDEQYAELRELLRDDPTAIDEYLSYLSLDAELSWEFRHLDDSDVEEVSATVEPSTSTDEASAVFIDVKSASLSRRNKRYDSIHWQRHRVRFNAMTAVLTAIAWAGFSYFIWFSTTPDDIRPNPPGEDFIFVAFISGVDEHLWADEMRPMAPNSSMAAGERLHLAEGLIEITFFDGAVVVLEGPTEFVVNSRGAGTLEEGSMAARVPLRAVGFVVDTPLAAVTDLGTEFGVEVHAGVVDVAVLSGEVEMQALLAGTRTGRPARLTEGQGAYIDAEGGPITRRENVDTQYVEAIRRRLDSATQWSRSTPGGTLLFANANFESPDTTSYTQSIDYWTFANPDNLSGATAGVAENRASRYLDHVSVGGREGDGTQWGFLQFSNPGSGEGVDITTTHSLGTVAAGTYTLTFDIGRGKSGSGDLGSSVVADLLSGGVSFGTATVALSSASDNRMDVDMVLVATVSAEDPAVGGDLKIRISHVHNGASPGTGFYQAAIDKVRLVVRPQTDEADEEDGL